MEPLPTSLQELVTKFTEAKEDEETESKTPELEEKDVQTLITLVKDNLQNTKNLVAALQFIGDLGRQESHRNVLGASKELLDLLVPLLSAQEIETKKLTARAIGNLCYEHAENRTALLTKDKILESLIELLSSEDEQAQRNSAGALANLASDNAKSQQTIGELEGIAPLVVLLTKGTEPVKCMAARALCNLVDYEANIPILVKSGGVDAFLSLVAEENDQLSGEVCNMMFSLCSNAAARKEALEKGVLKILLKLATSGDEDTEELQQSALETLAAFAEQEDARGQFISEGIYKPLLAITQVKMTVPTKHQIAVRRWILKIIGYLSLEDSTMSAFFEYSDYFISVCASDDQDIVLSGLMILGNLARSDEHCKKIISAKGFVDLLLKLTEHKDPRIVHLSLGALHNLAVPRENKAVLIKAGIMPRLIDRIKSEESNQFVQWSAVGALKNLIVGGEAVYALFVNEGGLDGLLRLARGELTKKPLPDEKTGEEREPDRRVEYEASRILARLTDKPEYAVMVAKNGGIKPLTVLITLKFEILQQEGLKALNNIAAIDECIPLLAEAGVQDILEKFNPSDSNLQQQKQQLLERLAKK